MTFLPSGTQPEREYYSSLNKLTNTIPLSNSRLKYLIEKQTSWTSSFTKAREEESVLDLRTHFKPTETFQYTHFPSCHQYGVKRGFIKGEALRLLRTNSSKTLFEENIKKLQITPTREGVPRGFYPKDPFRSDVRGQEPSTPTKTKRTKENLAFCNEISSSSA